LEDTPKQKFAKGGLITEAEFMQKLSAESAVFQGMLKNIQKS
jgi:hypothetical protein